MDEYDFLQRTGLCKKKTVDFISKKEGPVYFEQAYMYTTLHTSISLKQYVDLKKIVK